jgi:hypothetical protein
MQITTAHASALIQFILHKRHDHTTVYLESVLSRIGSSKKLTTVIEDMGPASQGMWSNKDTLLVRAPAAEFDRLAPLFSIIQGSIQLNPVWAAGEMRGQRLRAAAARETQLYLQEVGRQIVENRRQTNAEIAYGMYLFMNDQRGYVNLHTHQRVMPQSPGGVGSIVG